MVLPGYIEAGLSDHKPVCVEMRRIDNLVHAAAMARLEPAEVKAEINCGKEYEPDCHLHHGADYVQRTSPAVGNDSTGVVAILNAALYHVGGFRRQVDETLKEWTELHEFAEQAIEAEKQSLDWKYYGALPNWRSSKAEKEILCRAELTLGAKLSQHFVGTTEAISHVDDEEEDLQFEDGDTDDDGDLVFLNEEERKVRALLRRLLHNGTRQDGLIRQYLNWAVVSEGEPTQDQLPMWNDLPTAGNFKVTNPGSRGSQARASDTFKENQKKKYSRYLRWASERCGVSKTTFDEMLEHSRSLGQAGRRKAFQKLPRFLRAGRWSMAKNELPYAVLLCRTKGLRRAAMQQLPAFGDDAFAQSAADELERLLNLQPRELLDEKYKLYPKMKVKVENNALGNIGTLFEVWIVAEAAKRIGALEDWSTLIAALKDRPIDAPDVFPHMKPMGKDLDVFDIHEHMRALAPERGRISTKPQQAPTDSAKIRKGRYRLLGSVWALAWEQVKKELQLTYQEEMRVLDRDTSVCMVSLYDMLFPTREYVEGTVDGEKVTPKLNKEGDDHANTQKVSKGRGRGSRRAAGRGHTPGRAIKETDEPEKEEVIVAHANKAAKGRGRGRRRATGRGSTPIVEERPNETQKVTSDDDRILQRIWNSCQQYENRRGRLVHAIDCRKVTQLRMIDRMTIWKHAVWAWADGWLLGTMSRQDEMPLATTIAARAKLALSLAPSLAEEAIEDLGNELWMAHGYKVEAPTRTEAHSKLCLMMQEEAMARGAIATMDQDLRIKRAKLGESDRTQKSGTTYEVTASNGQKYRGRLVISGTSATFEEDCTNFRVTVPNADESFRSVRRDRRICAALKAKYIERSMKESRVERRKRAEEQLPKNAGDLVIKGVDDKGRLRYTWKHIEVLVTPLEQREPPPADASRIVIARAKESTADQALRKMSEKVRRMITKAARGECERIIAKNNILKTIQSPTENACLLYTSPSPRDATLSRMPSSA